MNNIVTVPPRGALDQELKINDTILFFNKYLQKRIAIIKNIIYKKSNEKGVQHEIPSLIEVFVINPVSRRTCFDKDYNLYYVRNEKGYHRYLINWHTAFTLDSRGMIIQNAPIEIDARNSG
jgi:hypothetical protein